MSNNYYSCNNNICYIDNSCTGPSGNCFSDIKTCQAACSTKMPSIYDYCNNPSQYKNSLSDAEILDYQDKCNALTFGDKAVNFSENLISNLINGMIGTTNGREILGIMFGKMIIEKGLREILGKLITDTLIKQWTDDMIQIGLKETAKIAMSIVGSALKLTIDIALVPLEVALPFLAPIEAALQIFMILGMLIDMWDPCDLKQIVGVKDVNAINKQLNDVFVNGLKSTVNHPEEDLNKRLIYRLGTWPVEYFIDNTNIIDAISYTNKQDFYNKKYNYYLNLYLLYAIPSIPSSTSLVITAADFKNLNNPNDILYKLSNSNSVVESFLKKYWPILIFFLILLIILIIFIINKNNNK